MNPRWIVLCAFVLQIALIRAHAQQPESVSQRPTLSNVKAFQKSVTFEPDASVYSSHFRVLTRKSGLKVASRDAELNHASVLISYRDQPIHAVMDAIAAMHLSQWEEDKNVFWLLPGRQYLDSAYSSGDQNKQARLQAGWGFIRTIESTRNNESFFSPAGLPFSGFSPSLQNDIRQMMAAMQKQLAAHPNIEVFVANLPQSKITIQREVGITGVVEYSVRVKNEIGDMGFRIHNYGDPNTSGNASNGGKTTTPNKQYYPTEKYEISPGESKNHPALRKTVTINLRGYTFPLVMRYLHQEYGIPFVSDLPKHMPQKANVSVGPVSLGEALDYLTSVYKDTEWEVRKSGFVIVRGPTNPARDAFQGKRQGEVKSGQ